MTSTLKVPTQIQFEIHVVVHEIEGGGLWGEAPRFPGCLRRRITRRSSPLRSSALEDWLAEEPEKTEEEARQLAAIQGSSRLADESYPRPYNYIPSPTWSEEDE